MFVLFVGLPKHANDLLIQPYTPNKTHLRWNRRKKIYIFKKTITTFGRVATPIRKQIPEFQVVRPNPGYYTFAFESSSRRTSHPLTPYFQPFSTPFIPCWPYTYRHPTQHVPTPSPSWPYTCPPPHPTPPHCVWKKMKNEQYRSPIHSAAFIFKSRTMPHSYAIVSFARNQSQLGSKCSRENRLFQQTRLLAFDEKLIEVGHGQSVGYPRAGTLEAEWGNAQSNSSHFSLVKSFTIATWTFLSRTDRSMFRVGH